MRKLMDKLKMEDERLNLELEKSRGDPNKMKIALKRKINLYKRFLRIGNHNTTSNVGNELLLQLAKMYMKCLKCIRNKESRIKIRSRIGYLTDMEPFAKDAPCMEKLSINRN